MRHRLRRAIFFSRLGWASREPFPIEFLIFRSLSLCMDESMKPHFHPPPSHSGQHILDLDDACLLKILQTLDPLPDLFSAAASCRVRSMPFHLPLVCLYPPPYTAAPLPALYHPQFDVPLRAETARPCPGPTLLAAGQGHPHCRHKRQRTFPARGPLF